MIAPDTRRWALCSVLLVAVLLWAPLPWGSVTPGAELIVRLAAFLLLAAALWGGDAPVLARPVAWPVGALAGLALLGWLQAASWPAALVGLVSPEHLRIERLSEWAAGGQAASWLPLSLAPAVSRSTALTLASLAAVVLGAATVGSRRRGRRWIAAALLAGALVQPVAGARRLLGGVPGATPGSALAESTNRLVGSFVHPNQLALFLEIALAVAVAALWWAWSGSRRREPGDPGGAQLAAAFLVVCVVAFALVLTRSRAGIAAAAAAVTVQSLAVLLAVGFRWRRVALLVGAGAGAAILGLTVLRPHLGRLFDTPLADLVWSARVEAWSATVRLWKSFPLSGTGLGTFVDGLPLVETTELTRGTWIHAHNQWVELLATGGLVGAALVTTGLLKLVGRLAAVLRSTMPTEDRAAALAALGALTATAVHELFDFSLTVPAIAVALAAVCGAAAAVPIIRPLRTARPREPGSNRSGSSPRAGARRPRSAGG